MFYAIILGIVYNDVMTFDSDAQLMRLNSNQMSTNRSQYQLASLQFNQVASNNK